MSGPDRNASEDSEVLRERIAQELAALGEDPLDGSSEDDLALEFALADGGLHADIDVATLQTLAGWADPRGQVQEDGGLSELAQARVWRTIELRGKPSEFGKLDRPNRLNRPNKGGRDAAQVSPDRSTRPVLVAVVALLAVAAGVVLVPVLTADTPEPTGDSPVVARAPASITAEELDALSTQARAGLAALDRLSGEPTGTARVEALASDYAGRLEALGNSSGHAAGPRGSQG